MLVVRLSLSKSDNFSISVTLRPRHVGASWAQSDSFFLKIRNQASGIWNSVSSIMQPVSGIWYLVSSIQNQISRVATTSPTCTTPASKPITFCPNITLFPAFLNVARVSSGSLAFSAVS